MGLRTPGVQAELLGCWETRHPAGQRCSLGWPGTCDARCPGPTAPHRHYRAGQHKRRPLAAPHEVPQALAHVPQRTKLKPRRQSQHQVGLPCRCGDPSSASRTVARSPPAALATLLAHKVCGRHLLLGTLRGDRFPNPRGCFPTQSRKPPGAARPGSVNRRARFLCQEQAPGRGVATPPRQFGVHEGPVSLPFQPRKSRAGLPCPGMARNSVPGNPGGQGAQLPQSRTDLPRGR